jgi:hypothetical protein
MLERQLRPKHCKVHGRQLEQDSVPVRYGLIKFREEYRRAASEHFPHAKKFVLGGCQLGAARQQEVMFCPECRAAESRWHDENPDFDDPSVVHGAVTSARRDLPDSLAKRILKQSQLEKPERVARVLWIVYRLSLNECIAYNAERRTYYYPYGNPDSRSYSSVSGVAGALNVKFDAERG